jgi:hypothetical protein
VGALKGATKVAPFLLQIQAESFINVIDWLNQPIHFYPTSRTLQAWRIEGSLRDYFIRQFYFPCRAYQGAFLMGQ